MRILNGDKGFGINSEDVGYQIVHLSPIDNSVKYFLFVATVHSLSFEYGSPPF